VLATVGIGGYAGVVRGTGRVRVTGQATAHTARARPTRAGSGTAEQGGALDVHVAELSGERATSRGTATDPVLGAVVVDRAGASGVAALLGAAARGNVLAVVVRGAGEARLGTVFTGPRGGRAGRTAEAVRVCRARTTAEAVGCARVVDHHAVRTVDRAVGVRGARGCLRASSLVTHVEALDDHG